MPWKNETIDLGETYDYASFTLTNGQSDYNVRSNQAALFSNIARARSCIIWTTRNISVKFNDTNYPAIPIDAGESPAEFMRKIEIKNIYLSNSSGNDATVKIWLLI